MKLKFKTSNPLRHTVKM